MNIKSWSIRNCSMCGTTNMKSYVLKIHTIKEHINCNESESDTSKGEAKFQIFNFPPHIAMYVEQQPLSSKFWESTR